MAVKRIQVSPASGTNEKLYLDKISKIFIFSQLILGVNRTALLNLPRALSAAALAYSLAAVGLVLYLVSSAHSMVEFKSAVDIYVICCQFIFLCIFDFVSCKRVENYYVMLNKFDLEVGCRPKESFKTLSKIFENSAMMTLIAGLFYASNVVDVIIVTLPIQLLGVHFCPVSEMFFIGHLVDLILPRICWINRSMESALQPGGDAALQRQYVQINEKGAREHVDMKKLMDLYQIIVVAFEMLIDATKWQILVILTFSFIGTLTFSYEVALVIINGTRDIVGALVNIGLLLVLLATLFSPCNSCAAAHRHALRLRELLATRLYDNKLNKASRSVARALLALTESRDLTFSLMNMFTVGPSLPFTFTALLITYLIILLQFHKVINN